MKTPQTTRSIKYCHIGAGKLGLGLVFPLFADRACDPIIFQRQADPENQNPIYENIRLNNKYLTYDGTTTTEIAAASLQYFDEMAPQGMSNTIEALAEADIVTVCTPTLPENLSQTLAKVNALRSKPAAFLVFANGEKMSSRALRKAETALKSQLDMFVACDVVSDRICPAIDMSGEISRVIVEPYMDVTIHADNVAHDLLVDVLGGQAGVRVTKRAQEFEFFERRKYWLLNGTHYALASRIRTEKINQSLQATLLNDAAALEAIESMQSEIIDAMGLYCRSKGLSEDGEMNREALKIFANEVLDRLRQGPKDGTERIFRDLYNYTSIAKDFANLEMKLKVGHDGHLKKLFENLASQGRHAQTVLTDWTDDSELNDFRQHYYAHIHRYIRKAIQSYGLAAYFAKVKTRIGEPLRMILNTMTGKNENGNFPKELSAAMCNMNEVALYYLSEAENRIEQQIVGASRETERRAREKWGHTE